MSIRKASVSIREDTDACSWAQKDLAKTEERQGERGRIKEVYSFVMFRNSSDHGRTQSSHNNPLLPPLLRGIIAGVPLNKGGLRRELSRTI